MAKEHVEIKRRGLEREAGPRFWVGALQGRRLLRAGRRPQQAWPSLGRPVTVAHLL